MNKIFRFLLKTIMVLGVIALLVGVGVYIFLSQPRFGREIDPESPRGIRRAQSENYYNGEFQNREPVPVLVKPESEKKGRIATLYEVLFERAKTTRPLAQYDVVKTDLHNLSDEDQIIWFGHSSYLIQIGGVKFLVDPVFEMGSPVSFLNKPFEGTDIYKAKDMPAVDYVIISHDHWDHLDYDTILEIMSRTGKFICPLGVGEDLEYWGVAPEKIIELDWDENAKLGPEMEVTALTARHYSGRLFNRNQTLWNGYMLEVNGSFVYLSGDTGYGKYIDDIASRFPKIDWAIIENGQYDQDWKYIHFIPEDLRKAIKTLAPTRLFTGHNSRFALARHAWDDPMNRMYETAQQDSINLFYPKIGEPVAFHQERWTGERWWK